MQKNLYCDIIILSVIDKIVKSVGYNCLKIFKGDYSLMGILDNYKNEINAYFSDWVRINDKNSGCGWTIEDFPYSTGVDENITKPHCWKCVTVNQCYFKNETGKKPEHFDYTPYSYQQIAKSKRGLYHPNCHCKEISIQTPIPEGKIMWLFNDKIHLIHKYGYYNENDIINELKLANIKAFINGNYKFNIHDEKGYRITIFAKITGINHRIGEEIKIKSGWTIFPDGKLKCNTLIGGEWK